MNAIKRPGQMYPLGFLFGLGFDTATEISLLVLAGAATGLPWYAIMVLPLLFASGMSLFDTLDGAFMQAGYQWAFVRPVRKVCYNFTTTGLSVAIALIISGIEVVSVQHEKAELTDPVTTWIAGINLDDIGYLIVALFVLVWVVSVTYWRVGNVEQRWTARLTAGGAPDQCGAHPQSRMASWPEPAEQPCGAADTARGPMRSDRRKRLPIIR